MSHTEHFPNFWARYKKITSIHLKTRIDQSFPKGRHDPENGNYFALAISVSNRWHHIVVLFAAYLDYEADINFMRSVSVGGIVLQVFLVKWREADIAPNKKWRFSYSGVLGFLGLLGIALIRDFSGTGSSNKAAVGYFIVFLILTLPVLISCSIQKGIKTQI